MAPVKLVAKNSATQKPARSPTSPLKACHCGPSAPMVMATPAASVASMMAKAMTIMRPISAIGYFRIAKTRSTISPATPR